jgi:hypothetical protein
VGAAVSSRYRITELEGFLTPLVGNSKQLPGLSVMVVDRGRYGSPVVQTWRTEDYPGGGRGMTRERRRAEIRALAAAEAERLNEAVR